MTALGVNRYRESFPWSAFSTSPAQPVPTDMSKALGHANPGSALARFDQLYTDLTSRGVTPMFIVERAPLWASTIHNCGTASYALVHVQQCSVTGQPLYPDPAYYPAWQAFVKAVAERYPQAVIEGPNEPDYVYAQGWPGAVNASTAAQIQCQLFQAVRSVDSRTVLSMGMGYDANYWDAFIAGAHDCYDAFSFQPYPSGTSYGDDTFFGPGSGVAVMFARLRAARSSAGDTTPIWITETGYNNDDLSKESKYADASRRLYNRLMTMSDVTTVMFNTLRDIGDGFGFFTAAWTPKGRACYFIGQHGGSFAGC